MDVPKSRLVSRDRRQCRSVEPGLMGAACIVQNQEPLSLVADSW
jgi:hypothetical protein